MFNRKYIFINGRVSIAMLVFGVYTSLKFNMAVTPKSAKKVYKKRDRVIFFQCLIFGWLVLSDEQMSNRWQFSLLNDEQMRNWLGVEHWPVGDIGYQKSLREKSSTKNPKIPSGRIKSKGSLWGLEFVDGG